MAWMRLEVSYIDHPKFLGLTDGAFRLWHEGKSYCEKHLTDGLIPKVAAEGFRHFSDRRCIELQTPVPGYLAALWELHIVGYKMHDYLDHNDNREVALKRMASSKTEKARIRQKQQDYRDRKKQERDANVTGNESVTRDPLVRDRTVPASTSSSSSNLQPPKEQEVLPAAPIRRDKQPPLAMGLTRFKVWRWMLEDCIATLGSHADAFDLDGFIQALDRRETRVVPNVWPWLKDEVLAEASRRGLPIASASTNAVGDDAVWDAIAAAGPSARTLRSLKGGG